MQSSHQDSPMIPCPLDAHFPSLFLPCLVFFGSTEYLKWIITKLGGNVIDFVEIAEQLYIIQHILARDDCFMINYKMSSSKLPNLSCSNSNDTMNGICQGYCGHLMNYTISSINVLCHATSNDTGSPTCSLVRTPYSNV